MAIQSDLGISIKISADKAKKDISSVIGLLQKLEKQASKSGRSASAALDKITKSSNSAKNAVSSMTAAMSKAQSFSSLKMTAAFKKASEEAKKANKEVKKFSISLKSLKGGAASAASAVGKLATVALAGVTAIFVLLSKKILDTGLAMLRLETTLTVVTGSMSAAKEEIKFLREEANRLGADFTALAKPFSKLVAASKGVFTSDQIRGIFTAFSEASVALKLTAADTQGVFFALQQLVSKGTVSSEELKRQLAERIPGAMRIAASSMNLTMDEFTKALKAGTVKSIDFMEGFADAIHEFYGEAAAQAANSVIGSLNRMKSAFFFAFNEVSASGPTRAFKDLFDTITTLLDGNTAAAKRLGEVVADILDEFTGYLESLKPEDIDAAVKVVTDSFTVWKDVILIIFNTSKALVGVYKTLSSISLPVPDFGPVGLNGIDDIANRRLNKDVLEPVSSTSDPVKNIEKEIAKVTQGQSLKIFSEGNIQFALDQVTKVNKEFDKISTSVRKVSEINIAKNLKIEEFKAFAQTSKTNTNPGDRQALQLQFDSRIAAIKELSEKEAKERNKLAGLRSAAAKKSATAEVAFARKVNNDILNLLKVRTVNSIEEFNKLKQEIDQFSKAGLITDVGKKLATDRINKGLKNLQKSVQKAFKNFNVQTELQLGEAIGKLQEEFDTLNSSQAAKSMENLIKQLDKAQAAEFRSIKQFYIDTIKGSDDAAEAVMVLGQAFDSTKISLEQYLKGSLQIKEQGASIWEKAVDGAGVFDRTLDDLQNTALDFTNGLADGIVDAVATGKASFQDLARSALIDIAKILARQALLGIVGTPTSATSKGSGILGAVSELFGAKAKEGAGSTGSALTNPVPVNSVLANLLAPSALGFGTSLPSPLAEDASGGSVATGFREALDTFNEDSTESLQNLNNGTSDTLQLFGDSFKLNLSEFNAGTTKTLGTFSSSTESTFGKFGSGMSGVLSSFGNSLGGILSNLASALAGTGQGEESGALKGIRIAQTVVGFLSAATSAAGAAGAASSASSTASSASSAGNGLNLSSTDTLSQSSFDFQGANATFAKGGVFSNSSQLTRFASGDVVDRATQFPLKNGKQGVMGEAGPEGVLPLKRGRDGKLGVSSDSGGKPINNNIVNIIDPGLFDQYVSTPAGEEQIINVISRNSATVNGVLA